MRIQNYGRLIDGLVAKIIVPIIKVYRTFISPILPPSCRFYPSCSSYAIEAYRKHGFIKGTFLAAFRIVKCNPFHHGGFDPVPDNFHFIK